MQSPADSHEMTILESKGILIHDEIFHAVLTDRRIILTRYADNKLNIRSIYFADIQKIEEGTDDSGDMVIIVGTHSAKGKIKKVVLHFSLKNFPDPHQESSLWASEINKRLQSVSRVPAPVLKKPPITQAFCVTCGTKCTDGSALCTKCGARIIYPDQPLPPQEIDTSGIKRVKITEIPVTKIDLNKKK
jgi:DNA-directed RNA polymerase subunit RPC12/RpoP